MFERITQRLTDDDETRTDGGRSQPTAANGATTDGVSTGSEAPDLDLDQVFGTLKNRRRRETLRYLAESEQVRLGDLAERIAATECDKSVAQLGSQERKRVYVGLYQCHLPKMADVGAVTYDKSRGTIERGPNFDLFVGYLPDEESVAETADDDSTVVESLSSILT